MTLTSKMLDEAWANFLRDTPSNRSVWEAFKYAWSAARPAPETFNVGSFPKLEFAEHCGCCVRNKITLEVFGPKTGPVADFCEKHGVTRFFAGGCPACYHEKHALKAECVLPVAQRESAEASEVAGSNPAGQGSTHCDHRRGTDDSGEFCQTCGERIPPPSNGGSTP